MSVGANIKAQRMANNMTQKELAEKVHVEQSMICQIERGTKVPTLPLSMDIAAALGCDISDLAKE
ncbi:MAG: helix-turn-helix transcriptional regulator [Acutalibacteraceae bacterium]|nr:helix-turn-helix transcriptional regulator [Acutalibacteraceae bacterium]